MIQKIIEDKAERSDCPKLAHAIMVPTHRTCVCEASVLPSTVQKEFDTPCNAIQSPSLVSQVRAQNMSCVKTKIESLWSSNSAASTIMASWRKGTQTNYQTNLRKWLNSCTEKGYNILQALVTCGIEFLATLYESVYSQSVINTARSALFTLLQNDLPFGQHSMVKTEEVYERSIRRPGLPRYTDIWDISSVFHSIRRKPEISSLKLKGLSH